MLQTEQQRLAYDLFSSSFFVASADARFITLMGFETLLELELRDAAARKHVDEPIQLTRASVLDKSRSQRRPNAGPANAEMECTCHPPSPTARDNLDGTRRGRLYRSGQAPSNRRHTALLPDDRLLALELLAPAGAPAIGECVRPHVVHRPSQALEEYSPFKTTDLRDPVLGEIAERQGVTPAQVVIRAHRPRSRRDPKVRLAGAHRQQLRRLRVRPRRRGAPPNRWPVGRRVR